MTTGEDRRHRVARRSLAGELRDRSQPRQPGRRKEDRFLRCAWRSLSGYRRDGWASSADVRRRVDSDDEVHRPSESRRRSRCSADRSYGRSTRCRAMLSVESHSDHERERAIQQARSSERTLSRLIDRSAPRAAGEGRGSQARGASGRTVEGPLGESGSGSAPNRSALPVRIRPTQAAARYPARVTRIARGCSSREAQGQRIGPVPSARKLAKLGAEKTLVASDHRIGLRLFRAAFDDRANFHTTKSRPNPTPNHEAAFSREADPTCVSIVIRESAQRSYTRSERWPFRVGNRCHQGKNREKGKEQLAKGRWNRVVHCFPPMDLLTPKSHRPGGSISSPRISSEMAKL